MIRLACEQQHSPPRGQLCAGCARLLAYARERIARCPHGETKPTCRNCPIHCYRPEERVQITEVMKFAGPRLLAGGDLAALKHLAHGRKPLASRLGQLAGASVRVT